MTMMHCQIRMELPSEARTVPLCRRTAQALLADLAVDADRAADIATVLSEAAGNVVRHAYPQASHLYHITLGFYTDRVRLEVADEGCGFARDAVPAPDMERLSGRGLWLIEQLADALSISTLPDGGCVLIAEFRLASPLRVQAPLADDPERCAPRTGRSNTEARRITESHGDSAL